MLMGSTHLLVQIKLDEIPECHLFIYLSSRLGHRLALLGGQFVVVRPLRERRCTIEVAIVAEGSVGHQPLLVLLEEVLEGLSLQGLGSLLGIYLAQIVHLGVVHALVVYLFQGVQFLAQSLEFLTLGLVLQLRQLAQVRVLRMQGVDADTVVGVRVLPGVGDVRIVDGQYLQYSLLGLCTPVDHHLQVAEVAYAKASLTTEREDGNHRSSALPRVNGEESLCQFVHHYVARFHFRQTNRAVHAVLPEWRYVYLLVEAYKLKLERLGQCVCIETDYPFVVLMLGHVDGTDGLPVAQCLTTADDGQSLVVAQLRGAHLQLYRLGEFRFLAHVQLAGSHALRESRRVHKGILWDVQPVVVGSVADALLGVQLQSVGLYQPFVAGFAVATHHAVIIINVRACLHGLAQVACPVQSVKCSHLVLLCLSIHNDVYCQFFSEGGLVLEIENDLHIRNCF